MARVWCAVSLLMFVGSVAGWGQKYSGPRPSKADVPYLLHASHLVETEAAEAREEKRKDDAVYVVAGADSKARTPLAEPILLIQSEKLPVEKLELYKADVRNGRREVVFPAKKRKDGPRPVQLSITRLDKDLYRVEAAAGLENGEYWLTPAGSNQVFCFQVY